MLRKAMLVIVMLFLAIPAYAAKFSWSYTAEQEANITGFSIYQQEIGQSDIHNYLIEPSARLWELPSGTTKPGASYELWITAYNAEAESARSDVVVYTEPAFEMPDNPAPVIIIIPEAVNSVTIEVGQ